MKIIRKTAVYFIIIGVVLSITALALGAKPNTSFYTADETFMDEYTDITDLDFDLKAGKVDIISGDKFKITAKGYPKNSIISTTEKSETGKNRWIIKERGGFNIQIGFGFDDYQSITIELPKDFVANEFNLDFGAGILNADYINSKKSKISIGAASFNIENLVSSDTDLECGAGNIEINGVLTGKSKIECGMGNIDLNLIGNPDDYSYSAEVGMGEIIINNESYGGIANEINKGNSNAENHFKLEAGMGKINLQINEERSFENESKETL